MSPPQREATTRHGCPLHVGVLAAKLLWAEVERAEDTQKPKANVTPTRGALARPWARTGPAPGRHAVSQRQGGLGSRAGFPMSLGPDESEALSEEKAYLG